MNGLWNVAERGADPARPALPPAFELRGAAPASPARYPTRPVRARSQLAVRAGLLAAVVLGCLGGGVGLLRSSGGGGDAGPPVVADQTMLPGSVAGVAELAVRAWLSSGDGDGNELDGLFLEPPARLTDGGPPLFVQDVTAVGGERLEDGYWTVIVAAVVVDPPEVPSTEGEPAESPPAEGAPVDPPAEAPTPETWYVEIGIVGNDAGGLSALTTPGILPGPLAADSGWHRAGPAVTDPDPGDPLAPMLDSFLNALLAGQGDPAPYLANGVDIPLSPVPVFASIAVDGMAVVQLDDGHLRVWVEATGTTVAGSAVPVAYELLLAPRGGRFDVLEFWGSPTVEGSPEPPSDPQADAPADVGGMPSPATQPPGP